MWGIFPGLVDIGMGVVCHGSGVKGLPDGGVFELVCGGGQYCLIGEKKGDVSE